MMAKGGLFQRRILVIRQDRIGDVVLATGLPRELKNRWPGCHVAVMVRSYTAPLFENNPYVDEVITDDYQPHTRTSTFWSMVRKLRSRRFTHALMLLPQARVNYMTFCAGIPFRYGHGLILFHVLTAVRPVMTRKFHKGGHEGEYSLDLARAMGVRADKARPEIHLSPAENSQVAETRARWLKDANKIIGLNTTSGNSSPNWGPAVWGALARQLAAQDGVKVVVTDYEVPPEMANIAGVDYPDQGQPIRSTVTTIAALDLLVSASTGPMHIAGALGVPTMSLFGPLGSCEPALWGPLGNEAVFVMPEAEYCRDRCPGDPHVCDYAGSRLVSPEAVAARITAHFSPSS